jgi:hypothetical protein
MTLVTALVAAKSDLVRLGIWHGEMKEETNSAICAWLAVDKSGIGYKPVEDILIRAIRVVTGEYVDTSVLSLEALYEWNDRTSDAVILRVYDKAIELAKADEDLIQFAHGAEPASDYIGGSWPEDH